MDLKISQLPELGEVLGIDVIPIVNNGITKKVSVDQLMSQAVSKDYVDAQDLLKVDKVDNERLINATEISKLEGIETGAEVNVNADWNATIGDAVILNKPIIPSIEGLATETYVNDKVSSVLRYKGSVANFASLPTTNLVIGDTWNLLDTGMNYAYTGITGALWDALGGTVTVGGFVPYTGAVANVDLGEFQLKAGQFEFDQTPTGVFNAGMVRWNDSDGTTERKLKGGNVTLQDGQETVKRVVNKTNANLLESQYKVVRIRTAAEGGSQGQRSAIVLAQANNNLNSNATLGVVTESILNNEEGFITLLGEVRQINTTGSLQSETWLDGDQLFLSATIAGGLTKVVPASPNYSIPVATVDYAHAINGKFSVNIGRRLALDTTLSGNNDTAPSVTAVRTYVNNITAIKGIDEGNGIGYVIANRNSLNYGNVGLGAVDLSFSDVTSSTYGSTGKNSFSTGEYNKSSGVSSFSSGSLNESSGISSVTIGSQNTSSGNKSFASGYFNKSTGLTSSSIGNELLSKSYAEVALGSGNTNYTPVSTTTFNALDRIFGVGNGVNGNSRSDALIILKNGLTTLPSVTNALISAEPTGKAVVTKEYLATQFSTFSPYNTTTSTGEYFQNLTIVPTIIGGMTATPPLAGKYKVEYNGQYNTALANITQQSVVDLNNLYLNLNAQAVTNITFPPFTAGTTIVPGVYSTAGAVSILGSVTLDGLNNPNSIFIFRTVAALSSGAGAVLNLVNGATANNVFFLASGAITLGAGSNISGTLISPLAAVGVGAGAFLNGRIFSMAAAISAMGNISVPVLPSQFEMGIIPNFAMFTSIGAVTNVGNNILIGDIGTNNGTVSGFQDATLSGFIYLPNQGASLCQFSIYVNGTIVPTSTRERTNVISKEDIVISDYVNITDGQTISIKVLNYIGISRFYNRNLTVTKI